MATPGPAMLPAPVATPTATPAEWTDGPVPEFTGTSWSDDEVIRRLLNERTTDPTVAFSDGAPAAKLYEADPNALAKYPSRSEADSALAMKFLFWRSEEHTFEIQSLMRISYAVYCLKKKHIKC